MRFPLSILCADGSEQARQEGMTQEGMIREAMTGYNEGMTSFAAAATGVNEDRVTSESSVSDERLVGSCLRFAEDGRV